MQMTELMMNVAPTKSISSSFLRRDMFSFSAVPFGGLKKKIFERIEAPPMGRFLVMSIH